MRKSAITLAVFLFLSYLVAAAGAGVTAPALGGWFVALEKPPLTPPGAVFGLVWPVLFTTMSVAAWLAWREGWRAPVEVRRGLILHFAQLIVNMGWSAVFFGMRWPLGGLAVIALLLWLVARMAGVYREVSAPAFWLTVPYLAWLAFAALLNLAIVILN